MAYDKGGLGGAASSLGGYLAWRLGGSPTGDIMDERNRLERTEATAIVSLMRGWYEEAEPSTAPKVSIVLPTRDRPQRVQEAIRSVINQSYENWELLVVNDGDLPLDAAVLTDDRIRILTTAGSGVAAARNEGLDAAMGEYVTYLDDDNLMDSHWIKSIVLTFEEAPYAVVMIGAQLVSPEPGSGHLHALRVPSFFDWEMLTEANYIDMGMLVHRADIETRFEPSLPALVDWDFVVRLTVDTVPVLAPALSGIYRTAADRRISYTNREEVRTVVLERFEDLRSSRTPTPLLGAHDASALTQLVRSVSGQASSDVIVVVVGDTPRLTEAVQVLESEGNTFARVGEVGEIGDDETYDVAMVDGDVDRDLLGHLRPSGIIIGLGAHTRTYDFESLDTQRRVGDQLWIGSPSEVDFESLFTGATLVKFGLGLETSD